MKNRLQFHVSGAHTHIKEQIQTRLYVQHCLSAEKRLSDDEMLNAAEQRDAAAHQSTKGQL